MYFTALNIVAAFCVPLSAIFLIYVALTIKRMKNCATVNIKYLEKDTLVPVTTHSGVYLRDRQEKQSINSNHWKFKTSTRCSTRLCDVEVENCNRF